MLRSLEANRAGLADPLGRVKPAPWYISVGVGGKELGIPFTVKEENTDGTTFGGA